MLGKIQGIIWIIWWLVCLPLCIQLFFLYVFKEIRVCEQHCGKKNKRIFMKSSGKVGHETRNTLKHFRDLGVNPLNPGSILIISGSVFLSNIMGKWVNGFSWNFHDISGTTQEAIIYTVSHVNRLIHSPPSRRGAVSLCSITVKWINRFFMKFSG